MSIIIGKDTRVIVQGITGNQGKFHAAYMLQYGTKVVAGVTPGKGGQEVEGVPVYNTVAETVAKHGANTSIIFVPARGVRDAALEAIDSGITTVVIITEGTPQKDSIELIGRAERKGGITIVGPNCPGAIAPHHQVKVGIMPNHIFKPGEVGIASRSGTLTYEIAWHLTCAGLGQSSCIGLGGDTIVGMDYVYLLKQFMDDAETKSVVLIGEIGGNAEETAAQYIINTKYPKRVVAYIAGRMSPPGKRMGHAGAIITGSAGTANSKLEAFARAGVPVAERPGDIPKLLTR